MKNQILALVMLTTAVCAQSFFDPFLPEARELRVCLGADDTIPIKCLPKEKKNMYQASRPVIRVWIKFEEFLLSHCTAWMLGKDGHIMTNQHCVQDQYTIDNLVFEFGAEGKSCSEPCGDVTKPCESSFVIEEPLNVVNISAELDYGLLQLPEKYQKMELWKKYGYMQLRQSGPVAGESIYVPQHPLGAEKSIVFQNNVNGTITPTTILEIDVNDHNDCGKHQITHDADTVSGSSGSPILCVSDNTVCALHHCGGCNVLGKNGGVPSNIIIEDLGDLLPHSAISGRC